MFSVSLVNADLLGRLQSGAAKLISKITTYETYVCGCIDTRYEVKLTIGTLPQVITGPEPESFLREINPLLAQGLFYGVVCFLRLLLLETCQRDDNL